MKAIGEHIVNWLNDYCQNSNQSGFVIGISGGVDSALTSTLCAMTQKKVVLVSMPIRQDMNQLSRAHSHIQFLTEKFPNVSSIEVDLTQTFDILCSSLPESVSQNELSMANTRSRLRMTTLYAVAQEHNVLVAGTGNKVEDFGVGFYTKYGDGGVDLSPIADLTKTQVWNLSRFLGVRDDIVSAAPTDGLWGEDRTDEDQLGATYPELEWAMDFAGDELGLSERQKEVLAIYRRFNRLNQHKMLPIPICKIPLGLL